METPTGRKRINYNVGYVKDGLQAARKRRLELLASVNSGGLRQYAGATTVAALADKFLAMRGTSVAAATRAIYLHQLNKQIVPAIGSMDVASVKRLHIEHLLADKAQAGLSWWSVDQTLRTLLQAAVEWQLIEHNPAVGIKHGRKTAKHPKTILSPAAFQTLLDALDERTACMVWLLASTGLRIGELIGLRWDDLDLHNGVLHVRRGWYRGVLTECKTPKSRRVCYLNPRAVAMLHALPRVGDASTFIFSDDGITPLDERTVLRHHLRSVLRKLGLYSRGAGWHSFRRLFVSLSQAAGASSIEAAMLVGHTSTSMTTDYTILQPERALALATGVGQRLLAAPDPV